MAQGWETSQARLSDVRIAGPYVVFDVHHVLDRLNKYQSLCLAEWLLHSNIEWGICSCGVGKLDRWINDENMRPMIEDAAFIVVNTRHVHESDRQPGTGKEYTNRWSRHNFSKEWVPEVAVLVDGHKGDVAKLLHGPSLLFDDRLDNCEEWCRLGAEGNEARLVSTKRWVFDDKEPCGKELWPRQHGVSPQELLPLPYRIKDSLPIFAAEKRSHWHLQILEFVEQLAGVSK